MGVYTISGLDWTTGLTFNFKLIWQRQPYIQLGCTISLSSASEYSAGDCVSMHWCEISSNQECECECEIDLLGVCLGNLSGVGWEGGGGAACMVAGIMESHIATLHARAQQG